MVVKRLGVAFERDRGAQTSIVSPLSKSFVEALGRLVIDLLFEFFASLSALLMKTLEDFGPVLKHVQIEVEWLWLVDRLSEVDQVICVLLQKSQVVRLVRLLDLQR